ncbi:PilZ domain-containing protein [Erythrobacter sp. KY5]|uniref:PilZ domain-containing protein n=1 Tax=Erythrobacter sp. KY5 TaxID=2011159 RepID=UPI0013A69D7F|nr:PilZ domain-containing protein [Erythrobacter sp. KY5]
MPSDFTDREWPRRPVSIAASIKDAHGEQSSGTLIDISERGCRIRFLDADALKVGDIYHIRFAGLNVQAACVAWSRSKVAGMRFVSLIESSVIGELSTRWKRLSAMKNARSGKDHPGQPLW